MSNYVQESVSLNILSLNDNQSLCLSEDKLSMLSSCSVLLDQSRVQLIDKSRKKRKQEKKKERRKKLKHQKAEIESEKIADIKEIMRKIYQESDTYYKYQKKLQDIREYIQDENTFLNALNSVIAGYVQKSLTQMDQTFDNCLKSQGIVEQDQMISYEYLLSERPHLFKKLTDCLYYKFLEICQAGTNVHMILKCLRPTFKNERPQQVYESLDRDIFEYLTENHEEFKNVILYAFRALVRKTKPLKNVDEQTINRIMEIFKIMRLPVQEQAELGEIPHPDSDSTQEQQKKSCKKKRKNKKKRKQQNPENLICQQQLEEYISLQELTARIIQDLHLYQDRLHIQLDVQYLLSLTKSSI